MSADLRAENEAVLRSMADRGDDLGKVRAVEFTAVFADKPSALTFTETVRAMGYMVEIEESGTVASHPWDAVAVREMVPTVDGITDAEIGLGDVAHSLDGKMDGWGCLRPD
jgi:hypothetical protein